MEKLKPLQNKEFVSEVEFEDELITNIGKEDASQYKSLILENAKRANNAPSLDKMGDAVKKCQKVVTEILKDKRALEPDLDAGMEEDGLEGDGEGPRSSSVAVSGRQLVGAQYSGTESRENSMWEEALRVLRSAGIRKALGQLFEASCSIPSVRGKNRYNLLMAKLCMKAQRPELARPIVEDLYKLIEELKLELWESPMWIAEVYDVLYQCLTTGAATPEDKKRAEGLFMKICTIDVTKRI
jgi:type VI secretion system protein ImpA